MHEHGYRSESRWSLTEKWPTGFWGGSWKSAHGRPRVHSHQHRRDLTQGGRGNQLAVPGEGNSRQSGGRHHSGNDRQSKTGDGRAGGPTVKGEVAIMIIKTFIACVVWLALIIGAAYAVTGMNDDAVAEQFGTVGGVGLVAGKRKQA